MKQKFSYQDCINLEYFFHEDSNNPPEQLHKRDRNIYLKKGEKLKTTPPDNRKLISTWLHERLKHEFPAIDNKSPGEIFKDTFSVLKILSVAMGSFFGIGAGLSFFTYSGTTPVNVFHFLIFFIFSQILLTILLGSSLFFRRITGKVSLPPFYSQFLAKLLQKLAQRLNKTWNKKISAGKRDSIDYSVGLIRSHHQIYGSLFYWPLFTLSQIMAFCFNAGLLGSTLFKITASDLAFGWQSTLQLSATALHKMVTIMAIPWSWFVPFSIALPSLQEIEGSRIVLKEGIYHLATENLVSWWPFLIFCLLFYGLSVRGSCYLIGIWMEKKSLQRIKLNSAPCRRLIQRMLTPLVSTQAPPEPIKLKNDHIAGSEVFKPAADRHLLPQLVLIPDDIYNTLPFENFNQVLISHGFSDKEHLKFMSDYDSDQQIKKYLGQQDWNSSTGLFFLMEGWMVPLVDFLTYLEEIRSIIGRETLITVALIGHPTEKTVFTTVSPDDYTIWQRKIQTLGDPYLTLFPLIPKSLQT